MPYLLPPQDGNEDWLVIFSKLTKPDNIKNDFVFEAFLKHKIKQLKGSVYLRVLQKKLLKCFEPKKEASYCFCFVTNRLSNKLWNHLSRSSSKSGCW